MAHRPLRTTWVQRAFHTKRISKNAVTGSLKSKLLELIRLRGALSVSDYMKLVLTNPESGFYMNNDVFGVKGHFTTNPEISQIFGELVGAWIFQEWHRFGCPKPLRLIEFGPGRGTLMSDVSRTVRKLGESPLIKLIETSPHLREVQKKTLDSDNDAKSIKWLPHVDNLEKKLDGFTAFIAHEFLDALPIHKFVRDPTSGRWRELLIDYDKNEELRFCISKQPSLAAKLLVPQDFSGDHIEVCPQAALTLEKVASRLDSSPGCMLVCDYGFEDEPPKVPSPAPSYLKPIKSNRDTLRAFKDHQSWPPLKEPGEADLTADVDFGYLKSHLHDKATLFGPVTQRNFLLKCGLKIRLDSLVSRASSDDEKSELLSGAKMMIDDMGDRYKFLAMFPKTAGHLFKDNPPAGFDEDRVVVEEEKS